jgi:cytidine deaminase
LSRNPFRADPAIVERLNLIDPQRRVGIRQAALDQTQDGILQAEAARQIVDDWALQSVRNLMLLLLETAERFALPPISNFKVGAVGLEARSGDLILAGNLEFPGVHLGFTMHGEGSVFTRAMHRGEDISVIAIGEAHPCAHCRQCLAEYAASDRLELIDPLGHTLPLAELYPWPFDPAYLDQPGAIPGQELWPSLHFVQPTTLPFADKLLSLGRRSHSPYSKCPGALILELRDGSTASGFAIESVAFNPTISPIQSALVELVAKGEKPSDIVGAVLGTVRGGAVDYGESTTELLHRLAPEASLAVLDWRT